MELDEFKQRFKEQMPQETSLHSADELEGYIRKRTRSIIASVKRNIRFEILACFVFIAVAIWAWFAYPVSYVRAISLLTVCVCCLLLVYLVNLYRKIGAYEQASLSIKNTLQLVIGILHQFTRVYFQFTMITLPLAFVFGLATGFLNIKSGEGLNHFNWQRAMVFYSGWFIVWSVIMYFLCKWYIRKLYGKYLQQLEEQLKDIENG